MRKGNAFSDIHIINAGYRDLSSGTLYSYDTVDIEFGGNQFFNSFRVNMTMAAFDNVYESFWFSIRLYHGDAIGDLEPVTKDDIIGPVDENEPIVGDDGEWKRLITYDGVSVKTMGYRVYSVGYIGNKKYIKSWGHTNGYPGTSNRRTWCFVLAMHTHVGKCYDRYKLRGITGAQFRYGTS
jgi:hypothetical protein